MKNFIKFIVFIIYSSLIFLINKKYLIFIFFINVLLSFNINLKKYFRNLISITPLLVITFLLNTILEDVFYACIVLLRFSLSLQVTIIYTYKNKLSDIAKGITYIFYPFKIFDINLREIYFMIFLSINMINVLKKELIDLKYAFLSKKDKISLTNIKYLLVRFFENVLKRVCLIDESLMEKGIDF